MRARVREPDALNALKPLEVASYLRVRGWRQEADLNDKGTVWLLPAQQGSVQRMGVYAALADCSFWLACG